VISTFLTSKNEKARYHEKIDTYPLKPNLRKGTVRIYFVTASFLGLGDGFDLPANQTLYEHVVKRGMLTVLIPATHPPHPFPSKARIKPRSTASDYDANYTLFISDCQYL
jgi:hypothetical protein